MVRILAIESSCDETSAAVVECDEGFSVKSNCIASQIERHKLFGGVVPEIASRMHIECISSVVDEALAQAECAFADIDAVAVTYAPGLVGALLVGVNYAKSLAYALQKPLIPVHHIEGHIFANLISNPELKPPFLCLVASGGHSSIVHVRDYNEFEVIAKTRDDAAGEAFDKVARVLGLGYPGGPAIQKAALEGDVKRFAFPKVSFEDSADFSFSGVKTAVINTVHQMEQKGEDIPSADVAASFQEAVCSVLSERLFGIARKLDIENVTLAGGVAANQCLRDKCVALAKQDGRKFGCPPLILCTDNAAMIAARGYYALLGGKTAGTDLNAIATKDITVKK